MVKSRKIAPTPELPMRVWCQCVAPEAERNVCGMLECHTCGFAVREPLRTQRPVRRDSPAPLSPR